MFGLELWYYVITNVEIQKYNMAPENKVNVLDHGCQTHYNFDFQIMNFLK